MRNYLIEVNRPLSGFAVLNYPEGGKFWAPIEDLNYVNEKLPEQGETTMIEFTEKQLKNHRNMAEESRRIII
jgi:hypothetical protein